MTMISRARARLERRAALNALLGKSERELRDIGVTRHQLRIALGEVDDPEILSKLRARSLSERPF